MHFRVQSSYNRLKMLPVTVSNRAASKNIVIAIVKVDNVVLLVNVKVVRTAMRKNLQVRVNLVKL